MKKNKKNKKNNNSDSDEDDSLSSNSDQLNLDVTPKNIPIAKLPDKLKTKKIIINISDTQYPVVQEVAQQLGWTIQRKQGAGNWDVWWTDRQILPDVLFRMHLHQKINHFPGIYVLARKNLLGLGLMAMKQKYPQQYSFFPQTWVIPLQFSQFRHYYENIQKGKIRTYIVKPQAQSQGRGIFLTRNIQDIINGNKYVIQKYIKNPFLLDGLKFDLRIYVLLAGTDPLRLYIYEEGLTRLATQKYQQPNQQNLSKSYIHLTNYSLNKNNPNYIYNSSDKEMNIGHKRTLSSTYQYLKKKGYDVQKLKKQIDDVIVKTTVSGLPLISHQYRYCQPQQYQGNICFHILGFDIMITSDLNPILLQINHTPSFQTSTPLDHFVKKNLIKDTLKLMRITSKNKKILFEKSKILLKNRIQTGKRDILKGDEREQQIKKMQAIRDKLQQNCLGGYKKIHPTNDQERSKIYQEFFSYAKKMEKQSNQTRKKILKQYCQQQKPKISASTNLKESPIKQNRKQKLTPPQIPKLVEEVEQKQKSLISPNKVHNFRSKINRKSSNIIPPLQHDLSLNRFNQIMLKLLVHQQAAEMCQKKISQKQQRINYFRMKNSMFEKKINSIPGSYKNFGDFPNSQLGQNKVGSFLVPKNYEINDDREKYRPNISIKSIFKISTSSSVKSSQSAAKNFDKLRKAI